jgi:acyl-coenzyme A synthetase/AMP-(fatty) acid ligase
MLSCAKLGIHFSVLFEDLASEAISKRILLLKPDIFFSKCEKKIFTKTILKKISLNKKIKFLFFEDLKKLINIIKLIKQNFFTSIEVKIKSL